MNNSAFSKIGGGKGKQISSTKKKWGSYICNYYANFALPKKEITCFQTVTIDHLVAFVYLPLVKHYNILNFKEVTLKCLFCQL